MVLRGTISSINWPRAFGELILIVVGVFIALEASEWKARINDRQAERLNLSELHSSLLADIDTLNQALDRFQKKRESVELIVNHLKSREPYVDTLDAHFGRIIWSLDWQKNAAVYESLKLRGLTLISNSSLRSQIVQMYEFTLPRAAVRSRSDGEFVVEHFRPYFLENFRDVDFGDHATPRDYEELLADTTFLNTLKYSQQLMTQGHIPPLVRAIDEVRRLTEAIENELEALN